MLRRVLNTEQMTLVENAIAQEEDQYVDALAKKLSTWVKEIKDVRQQTAEVQPAPTEYKPARKSRSKAAKKSRASKK